MRLLPGDPAPEFLEKHTLRPAFARRGALRRVA